MTKEEIELEISQLKDEIGELEDQIEVYEGMLKEAESEHNMKKEREINKEYAEKLSELILKNPGLGVIAWIDTDGIDDDYPCIAGNIGEPTIVTVAINHDNVYIEKDSDDYENCYNFYGCKADDWTDEEIAEKAELIPWEKVIAVAVSAQ